MMDSITNLAQSEWLMGLGWTLIHSVWQVGIIALLLFVFNRLVSPARSELKYAASIAALAVSTVWILVTFAGIIASTGLAGTERMFVSSLKGMISTEVTELTYLESIRGFAESNMPMLVFLWSLGLLLFSLRLTGGWLLLYRLRNGAIQIQEMEVLNSLDQIAIKMNLRKKVLIAESHEIVSPVLIGFIKPMILLPISYINRLSLQETEAILAHELAHIKRYDFLLNIMQSIVETVLFFNPFVWYISSVIREEREHCCDDLAIQVTGQRKVYAETLATVQEIRIARMALGMAGQKGKLFERIQRIFEPGQRRTMDKWITAVLLIAMVAGVYWQGSQIDLDKVKLPFQTASLNFEHTSPSRNTFFNAVLDTIPAPRPGKAVEVKDENVVPFPEMAEVEPDINLDLEELAEMEMPVELEIPAIEEMLVDMDFATDIMEIPVIDMAVFVDTIPLGKEEFKVMMEQQMVMMKEHQQIIREQMMAMKEEMARMQEMMQSETVRQAMQVMEDFDFEGLSDEQKREMKLKTEKAQQEAFKAMKDAELQMQQQRKELEKEQKHMFEEQRRVQEYEMQKMKKEMEGQRQEMKELQKKNKAYIGTLRKELVKDGYLDAEDSNLNMNTNNGEMTVNGKKVKNKDKEKYDNMRKEFFKDKE